MFYELMTLSTFAQFPPKRLFQPVSNILGFSVFGAGLALIGFFFLQSYSVADITFMPGGILDMTKVAGNEGVVLAVTFRYRNRLWL